MNAIYFTPIVGAGIGYFTNWLAIKMIFRPYEEKRIFGVKVPFTPGLIAVERPRITEQIGHTITNHLLTDDDIKNKILEIDFDEYIRKIIVSIENEVTNNDLTLENIISNTLKDDYSFKKESFKNLLVTKYYINAHNEKTDEDILLLENNIRQALPDILNIIKTIFENDMYNIDDILMSFFDSIIEETLSGFSFLVSGIINSEKLYTLLKDKIITSINDDNEAIEQKIIEIVHSNANADNESFKIDNIVDVLIDNFLLIKVNSLKYLFDILKTDTAIEAISNSSKKYLADEMNNFLSTIDIKTLIIDKINLMPLSEIEYLIMTIAKKEINSITYLGGFLGFIIGILSLLFY